MSSFLKFLVGDVYFLGMPEVGYLTFNMIKDYSILFRSNKLETSKKPSLLAFL